jgi:hypothetical protein
MLHGYPMVNITATEPMASGGLTFLPEGECVIRRQGYSPESSSRRTWRERCAARAVSLLVRKPKC